MIGYRVVIAEDEEFILQSLMRMPKWRELGFTRIIGAANGLEGLAKIREIQPDIVLTDIKMPFLDGISMLEQSIGEFGYKGIIISGHEEFAFAKKALSLGVSEYLLKPVDVEELFSVIERLLHQIETTSDKNSLQILPPEFREPARKLLDIDYINSLDISDHEVRSLLSYAKEHYSERFSISDLSGIYHMSGSYLNTKFKEFTGFAFNEFLNRYRILEAMLLLSSSDMLVYQVAKTIGFDDYKYFILVFKKYLGISPAKFKSAVESSKRIII